MSIIVYADATHRVQFPNWQSNVPPVAETLVGETLRILPTGPTLILRVDVIHSPDAAQLVLRVDEAGRIASGVVTATGRYQLSVVLSEGEQVDVRLVVCEPECLHGIPDLQRSGGAERRSRGSRGF